MADFKTPGVPIRAVLFDWDGTVADTRPGIFNSVRYAIREHGIPDDQIGPLPEDPYSRTE